MDRTDRLVSVAREFALDAVYAFGSRADEVCAFVVGGGPLARHGSDIDIGVLPAAHRRLDARQRADLVIELERLLPGATVDLVVLPEAPAFLAADVVSGALLVVEDRKRGHAIREPGISGRGQD